MPVDALTRGLTAAVTVVRAGVTAVGEQLDDLICGEGVGVRLDDGPQVSPRRRRSGRQEAAT